MSKLKHLLDKIAALDLGSKKIGVAVSSSGLLASPKNISKGFLYPDWIEELKKIILEEKISLILVGIPVKQGDLLTKIGKIFLEKIKLLKKSLPTTICWKLIDERGSSQEASLVLTKSKKKSKKINLDCLSAVRLLEDYLENKRKVWDVFTFLE